MPSAHLILKEEEAIRLVLEFLSNRELSISQLSVERETGVINGVYSDDMLFLRQLILDGQWDDVLGFIQPLEGIDNFDSKQFHYVVIKHKYIELLCIRSESGPVQSLDVAVEEVVKCLNDLEKYCPTKEDYNNLCLLLTLPRLSDHLEYRNWNPSNARVNCFKAVHPLVEKFLPFEKKTPVNQKISKGDRLIQLIIKGILYESCVEYCQQRATSSSNASHEMQFAHLLNGTGFSDSDLSLLSWLQCIPPETFSYPFEQKTLSVDVEQLEKPCLEASWSEQILVTPIKPKIFPHSATPFTRLRSADFMSRSLTPNLDGLSQKGNIMAFSMGDLSLMSRSFAGFHLTGKKSMITSVDRLFEAGDVFSTSYSDLQAILETPSPKDKSQVVKINEKQNLNDDENKTCINKDHDSRLNTPSKTINESQKDEKLSVKTDSQISVESDSSSQQNALLPSDSSSSDLWKEFQRQKQHLLEELQAQEKQREQLFREINSGTSASSCINLNQNMENNVTNTSITSNMNQIKYPHSEQLTTSTPKSVGNKFSTPPPQTSPVLPRNDEIKTGSLRYSGPISKNLGVLLENAELPSPQTNSIQYTNIQPSNPAINAYGTNINSVPASVTSSGMTNASRIIQNVPPTSYNTSPVQTAIGNTRQSPIATLPPPDDKRPRFLPVTRLEDAQAIRTGEFHPSGRFYAIGSNSKTLRICSYPKLNDLRDEHIAHQPTVLFKRLKHHKGSIYCLTWNNNGNLLATGSNDKTVKLMRFNNETSNIEGNDAELTMHDGTVRDMCFVEDASNRSSLLISGGAGDCKIYVTDCETATPFQALSGHSGHILTLFTWGGSMFVSGSQDRTIRFWDLRTQGCVNLIATPSSSGSGPGSPVAAVCVDPSGRLLVSGHEDAACLLYDIRGGRMIQCFRPHTSDVRSIRFSPKAYYLLTASYDHKIVLTDLQGDLTQPLPSIVVADHTDKVIQARWHPQEFSFLSTSADKTAVLWALPN